MTSSAVLYRTDLVKAVNSIVYCILQGTKNANGPFAYHQSHAQVGRDILKFDIFKRSSKIVNDLWNFILLFLRHLVAKSMIRKVRTLIAALIVGNFKVDDESELI